MLSEAPVPSMRGNPANAGLETEDWMSTRLSNVRTDLETSRKLGDGRWRLDTGSYTEF